MDHASIIHNLSDNLAFFSQLLTGTSEEEVRWKPAPDKWCLLEVLCHLVDEEREDFRARVRHVLLKPEEVMPPIDPQSWVHERKYISRDYSDMLDIFLEERKSSVAWLQSLVSPPWTNTYQHPTLGPLSAELFLANWLAHDYLHIRQILGLKYALLGIQSKQDLRYAGGW
ncbi:MAG: DinB family protein [Saprospirales bacterium]|nr:DinB family protein [Saprospirales bacterium]MBK8489516.1 DinB family protein [Saprospirales bacterium]